MSGLLAAWAAGFRVGECVVAAYPTREAALVRDTTGLTAVRVTVTQADVEKAIRTFGVAVSPREGS